MGLKACQNSNTFRFGQKQFQHRQVSDGGLEKKPLLYCLVHILKLGIEVINPAGLEADLFSRSAF